MRIKKVLIMLPLLALALTSWAQEVGNSPQVSYSQPPPQKVTGLQQLQQVRENYGRYPLLRKHHGAYYAGNGTVSQAKVAGITQSGNMAPVQQTVLKVDGNTTLWGNVIQSNSSGTRASGFGVYSFDATSPITMTLLGKDRRMQANGGGIIYDGVFHCMSYSELMGLMIVNYREYDTDTWTYSFKGQPDASLVATDVALDPVTKKVYGCFYDSNMESMQIGSIDYTTITRTTSGDIDLYLLAVAIDSEGQMYGIDDSGMLYKVNKDDASYSKVGSTGVTPNIEAFESAVINPATNNMYWSTTTEDGTSSLYQVDLQTGAASKISDFPDGEQVVALSLAPAPIGEDAPGEVTGLTATFEGPSLTGTVSFTLPTQSYSGGSLSGELQYEIVDDTDTIVGSAAAGTPVSETIHGHDGINEISVVVSNAAGSSPKTKTSVWAGYDVPYPVNGLRVTVTDSVARKVRLEWQPPTRGRHDAYFDADNLRYIIVRLPDNDTLSADYQELYYEDQLPDTTLTAFSYTVTPVNGNRQGDAQETSMIALGTYVNVPYRETFDTQNDLLLWKRKDMGESTDQHLWTWSTLYKCAQSPFDTHNPVNSWLISPNIKMEGGKVYALSFKVRRNLDNYPEKLAVWFGQGDDVTSYTSVIPEFVVPNSNEQWLTQRASVSVPKDGYYSIAFQATSDADMFHALVDDVTLVESSTQDAPDVVTNLKVTPAAEGQLQATISFDAPTSTVGGEVLDSIDKIVVYRSDNTPVDSIINPAPGTAGLSVTDNHPSNGENIYGVVAYNSAGEGMTAHASAYIGQDKPSDPANVQLQDKIHQVRMYWDKATTEGANGGYVIPDSVTYNIFDVDADGYATSRVTGVHANDTLLNVETNVGPQSMLYFGLQAQNVAGRSKIIASQPIIQGESYNIPVRSSFAGGTNDSPYLWWGSSNNDNSFFFTSELSSDDDGGCVAYMGYSQLEQASLNTGKINLSGAANPHIVLSYYGMNMNGVLSAIVRHQDGSETRVDSIDFANYNGVEDWQTWNVDLSAFKSEPYVILRLNFLSKSSDNILLLDNINVLDYADHNLSISAKAPTEAVAGDSIDVSARITNFGAQQASGYKVRLYADGKVVDEKEGPELASLRDTVMTLGYRVPVNLQGNVTLRGEVDYEQDAILEDNTTEELPVLVVRSDYDTVADLTASLADKGIQLNWTAPVVAAPSEVTDGFEDYTAFAIDNVGKWTLVDGDKGATYGFQGLSWPHMYEPYAYIVFNPDSLGNSNPYYAVHSGKQAMLAVSTNPNDGNRAAQNDDWLISPALPGVAQTLSFYARGIYEQVGRETFQVLASDKTKRTEDFSLIKEYTNVGDQWQKYDVELPYRTRYFAIRYVSADQMGFMVDDVTYMGGKPSVIVGYRVYRDGELIATIDDAAKNSFLDTDAVPEGNHVYNVTVIYDLGESAYSNDASVIVTGISNLSIDSDGKAVDIYMPDGRLVRRAATSLNGLPAGMYVTSEHKVILVK